MNDSEKKYALRQGHEIAAEDGYFYARPQIDSLDRRKVFSAGFDRGWYAALAAAPAQPVAEPAHTQDALISTMLDALTHARKALNHNNLALECGPINSAILAARASHGQAPTQPDTSAEYAKGYAEGFNDACADTRVGELQRENAALRGQCQVIAWRVDHQSVLGHGAIRGDWRDGCPSEDEVLELKECLPSSVIYFAYGLAGTAPAPSEEYSELPAWSKMDNLNNMVPSEIRTALRAYADATHALRTGDKP